MADLSERMVAALAEVGRWHELGGSPGITPDRVAAAHYRISRLNTMDWALIRRLDRARRAVPLGSESKCVDPFQIWATGLVQISHARSARGFMKITTAGRIALQDGLDAGADPVVKCPQCRGHGYVIAGEYDEDDQNCPRCEGHGHVPSPQDAPDAGLNVRHKSISECPRCHGSGCERASRSDDFCRCRCCEGVGYLIRSSQDEDSLETDR